MPGTIYVNGIEVIDFMDARSDDMPDDFEATFALSLVTFNQFLSKGDNVISFKSYVGEGYVESKFDTHLALKISANTLKKIKK